MKLYRSIGEKELTKLLRGIPVRGMYDCNDESQNSSNLVNVVCFFEEQFRWKDKEHLFLIVIETNDYIDKGTGTYYVSREVIKNKVWTGRRGDCEIILNEVYLDNYRIENVKEIYGLERYAKWYFNEQLKPILEKYNIKTDYK